MFSRKLISSDAFLDMPLSTQALFFHLCMRADDDGFIDAPKKVCREVGASQKSLRELIDKRYVLSFPSGVILIKHWFIHNSIAKDRYTPTVYTDERAMVQLKCGKSILECNRNDNKSYTEIKTFNKEETDINVSTSCKQDDNNMSTECNQSDNKMLHRIDKNREEENSKDINVRNDDSHDADSSLEQFFESIWALYPSKKGKGQISYAKKVKLKGIGYDHIARCIERYIKYLKDYGKEQYIQNGSTFFNSGYVDYLDENYESDKPTVEAENTKTESNDRFSCLEPDRRLDLESRGVIVDESIDWGEATSDDISYLSAKGLL